MAETTKRRGTQWSRANLEGISPSTQKLLDTYKTAHDSAQKAAKTLRAALNAEWLKENKEGRDGRLCTFNVLNGVVTYAWIEKESPPEDGEVLF